MVKQEFTFMLEFCLRTELLLFAQQQMIGYILTCQVTGNGRVWYKKVVFLFSVLSPNGRLVQNVGYLQDRKKMYM